MVVLIYRVCLVYRINEVIGQLPYLLLSCVEILKKKFKGNFLLYFFLLLRKPESCDAILLLNVWLRRQGLNL